MIDQENVATIRRAQSGLEALSTPPLQPAVTYSQQQGEQDRAGMGMVTKVSHSPSIWPGYMYQIPNSKVIVISFT